MRNPKLRSLMAALACVASVACGGSGGDGATVATTDAAADSFVDASDASEPADVAAADTATAGDAPSDAVVLGPYPSGPYGTNEGDVLADLQWEGYVDELGDAPAKTKPYVTTSMGAIRNSGRRYALVHLAEFL